MFVSATMNRIGRDHVFVCSATSIPADFCNNRGAKIAAVIAELLVDIAKFDALPIAQFYCSLNFEKFRPRERSAIYSAVAAQVGNRLFDEHSEYWTPSCSASETRFLVMHPTYSIEKLQAEHQQVILEEAYQAVKKPDGYGPQDIFILPFHAVAKKNAAAILLQQPGMKGNFVYYCKGCHNDGVPTEFEFPEDLDSVDFTKVDGFAIYA